MSDDVTFELEMELETAKGLREELTQLASEVPILDYPLLAELWEVLPQVIRIVEARRG